MNGISSITSLLVISVLLAAGTDVAPAQSKVKWDPTIVTQPPSSAKHAADGGFKAHTHLLILGAGPVTGLPPQAAGPPFAGAFYETPASLACIYNLQPGLPGCNPYLLFANPKGGKGAIALVDAYDDPNAFNDLQYFSAQFGLTPIKAVGAPGPGTPFSVVFAPHGGGSPGGCVGPATRPSSAQQTGWDIEESLDIEYAHAMAPSAAIFLVEAQSGQDSPQSALDLACAVTVASNLVRAAGGGDVSMSWGFPEEFIAQFFGDETIFDPIFTTPGVVYFASSGDGPGVNWPSASPNVVAVGGTTLSTNPLTGQFQQENTWVSSGGGMSAFETRPSYQNGIIEIVGSYRGVPDVAADADPYTGAWVFDSLTNAEPAWFIVGGTSLASPLWAGIVNSAGSVAVSSNAELTQIYTDPPWRGDFNVITFGFCGPYMGYIQSPGQSWHFCTGVGSPKGYAGK